MTSMASRTAAPNGRFEDRLNHTGWMELPRFLAAHVVPLPRLGLRATRATRREHRAIAPSMHSPIGLPSPIGRPSRVLLCHMPHALVAGSVSCSSPEQLWTVPPHAGRRPPAASAAAFSGQPRRRRRRRTAARRYCMVIVRSENMMVPACTNATKMVPLTIFVSVSLWTRPRRPIIMSGSSGA